MKKTALVTGGTKGLGLTISQTLAKNNYKVYAASRNPENIDNKSIQSIKLDISSKSQCNKFNKKVDLLVNNAGISSSENIEEMFAVNVFGPYYLMSKNNINKIINITSLNALVPTPNAAIYSASKHALEALGISMSYSEKTITNIACGAIYNPNAKAMKHKPIRVRFPILKYIFPMLDKRSVAQKVLEIAQEESPPKRVVMGLDAKFSYTLSRLFPNIWFYSIDKINAKK